MRAQAFKARYALSDDLNFSGAIAGSIRDFSVGAFGWKYATAFAIDGVGDLKPPVIPALLITTDNVPDSSNGSNPVLTVTPAGTTTPIVSTIDTIGDQDYYQVTLTAGVTYEFGLYSYTGGPNAVGLTDPYLELYAADGTTLIVSADGGADTPYNDINSGFDTLLVYTPTATGTYFVNARAFSNSPATNDGDSIGDYQLFARVQDPNDPTIYHPYYPPTSPLYAIDWGTMVDKVNTTARNPDGNEGTRATGNPQGTPTFSNVLDIPALAAAQGVDITGKNVITIYFAQAGDIFVSNDPTNPGLPPATITAVGVQQFEYDAVWTALHEFSKVADVVYLEVDDRDDADFIYTSYQGTPGPGISLLGSMSPPGESDEGLAQFNSGDERWNARDLAQGGFSFVTLIHEFGHGHGLAHPHDNGGHSGIMNGVEEEGLGVADYTTGDYALNQGVFTMMSYEDGWQSSPYGNADTDVGFGYLGGLMALDIAAIQDKYGVNEDYNTGDNTYVMPDENVPGTFFYSIWDAGGTDEIVYYGTSNATIDLRAATLQYEVGGGGWVSYAYGIYGGFTIANGVTIENASSSTGNDTLVGNSAGNILDGGTGDDFFNLAAGGTDSVIGGAGADGIYFGAEFTADDAVDGGDGTDQLGLQGDYAGARALTLGAGTLTALDQLILLPGSDTRFGDTAGNIYDYDITTNDANVAAGAVLTIDGARLGAGEDLTVDGSAETDGAFFMYAGHGVDTLLGGDGDDGFLFRGAGKFSAADTIAGGPGEDQIGFRANYTGADAVVFTSTTMTGIEGVVFVSGHDLRFGSDAGDLSYDFTSHETTVAAGQNMIIDAGSLRENETLTFDGSAESDGQFTIYGGRGADVLTGGEGNDLLRGGRGADVLTGGDGNDTFRFDNVLDAAPSALDTVADFTIGDMIDLSRVDANSLTAGDQSFAFIGSAVFSSTAGELRATVSSGATWLVEGDTDGNGAADFAFLVTVTDADPITGTDFVP
jgi:hypothetical protein